MVSDFIQYVDPASSSVKEILKDTFLLEPKIAVNNNKLMTVWSSPCSNALFMWV